MESSSVELKPDNCEDKDGERDQKADLHEGGEGLEDGLQNHLQA